MKEFSTLKRIFSDYKADVDGMAESYAREAAADSRYNDQIRAERAAARNADFNARIDSLAEKARAAAEKEITALEAALGRYVASGDADRITKLQAILTAGITLSPIEADSLAADAGYLEMKLLEKATGGRIAPPSLATFEQDIKDLKFKASGLSSYRGGLAAISNHTGLFGGITGKTGMGATTSSVIVEGWLTSAEDQLNKMSERWAKIGGGESA